MLPRPLAALAAGALVLAAALTAAAAPDDPTPASLAWTTLPDLPAPRSGHIAGLLGGSLVVLGGTDFPVGLFDGGAKLWYDDGFVLDPDSPRWRILPPGVLPRPLAYAAALTVDTQIVVAGGSDATRHYADAFVIERDGDRFTRTPLPPLPVPTAMAGVASLGRTVFIVGGQETPTAPVASRQVWALDLDHPARGWRAATPLPGPGRLLPVVVAQAGALHVVSGASLAAAADGTIRRTYLTDAWRLTPDGHWTPLASVPRPVVAAPAAPAGQSHILVLGGDDGRLAARVQELRDAHPGFSRDVLAYHVITDTWVRMGTLPAGLVTTTAVRAGDALVIPGGEDRPGHRSPAVVSGTLELRTRAFFALDYLVLGAYLLPLIWIGAHFSGRNETRDDFFLGGRRVPWWAAGLSIYGTQLSAITFLAIPAKAYAEDWTFLPGNLSIVLIAPIVVAFYLPFYRGLRVTTAYEYLEHRFNLATRLIGSLAFISLQWARMAIVLYLPALALAAVSGLDVRLSVLLMGVLCTAYTLQGGMRAVIWADVLQVVVLFAGALVSLMLIVWSVDGGAMTVMQTGYDAGKLRMADWRADVTIASIWVVLGGSLVAHLVPYTADQAVVQRYLTTRDEAQAARAVWVGAALAVPTSVLFFAVGTALYVFYRAHPELLSPTVQTDATFSWFIAQQLPMGVSGLVVSGIFAAAMSTLSSSINSITTAIVTDFSVRLRPQVGEARHMRLARRLTVVVGAAGTMSALMLATWDIRSIWDMFLQAVGLFGGGLAGIFALGIFTRRAHGAGAIVGFAASAVVLVLVQQHTPLHFLLYAGIGVGSAFAVGYVVSLVLPSPGRPMKGLTVYDRPAQGPRARQDSQDSRDRRVPRTIPGEGVR